MILFARHDLISDPPVLPPRPGHVPERPHLPQPDRPGARVRVVPLRASGPAASCSWGARRGPSRSRAGSACSTRAAGSTGGATSTWAPRRSRRSPGPAAGRPRGPAGRPRRVWSSRYGQWTLEAYAPPRLLVDEQGEVTHVFGRAGDYLRDREGPVTKTWPTRCCRAFQIDLRTALQRAFAGAGRPTPGSTRWPSPARPATSGSTSGRPAGPSRGRPGRGRVRRTRPGLGRLADVGVVDSGRARLDLGRPRRRAARGPSSPSRASGSRRPSRSRRRPTRSSRRRTRSSSR